MYCLYCLVSCPARHQHGATSVVYLVLCPTPCGGSRGTKESLKERDIFFQVKCEEIFHSHLTPHSTHLQNKRTPKHTRRAPPQAPDAKPKIFTSSFASSVDG